MSKQTSFLTCAFALLFAVFCLGLIVLRQPFAWYPLMSNQDVADLLTPLVLIAFYWLIFKAEADHAPTLAEEIFFILLAALWVLGHGMHLAANSIDNLMEGLAKRQALDVAQTSLYTLTYFLDEKLSHFIWHGGVVGLAGLLIGREWRATPINRTSWPVTLLAGVLHGFTLFCIFLEGQTVTLGVPAVLLLSLLTLIRGRQKLAQKPVLAFFFIAGLAAALLFIGWGIYWGGFPQFTDVGLI